LATTPSSMSSITARARSRASPAWDVRRKAPIMTFSSTVICSNVCGTWKVRARPRRGRSSAGSRVVARPSNRTTPHVGCAAPVSQLNSVDLPSPLGPIRPRMVPGATARLASSTARKLPNALVMLRASISIAASRSRRTESDTKEAHQPHCIVNGAPQEAARLYAGDEDDDRAIGKIREAAAGAAEQTVGQFLQRHQDDGAHERTEQQP